jgi:hypothetical protein
LIGGLTTESAPFLLALPPPFSYRYGRLSERLQRTQGPEFRAGYRAHLLANRDAAVDQIIEMLRYLDWLPAESGESNGPRPH